jgi:hypothetical protein
MLLEKFSANVITLLQTSSRLEVCAQNYGLSKSHELKGHNLGVSLVAKHIVYYKGEGVGFPQVWVVVSLVSLSLFMARFSA